MDALNPFAELENAWKKNTTAVSMFLSMQYGIIIVMLIAVILKYGVSKFSRTLLSSVFMDLYGVIDRKHIRRIYEPRSICRNEPMIKMPVIFIMESVLLVKEGERLHENYKHWG